MWFVFFMRLLYQRRRRIDDRLGALLVLGCDDIKAAILGGPVVSGQGNGKEECVLHECIIPDEERKASHFREKV